MIANQRSVLLVPDGVIKYQYIKLSQTTLNKN